MKYLLMNMRDIDIEINRKDKVSKLHFSPVLYDDVD
jgi:dUTPase